MARPIAAPRPADRLDEQLVRPLRGALVGEVECHVRRHDPDQRDRRDIEALGDEAGPDQDVETPVGKRIDDARRGPAMLDHVPVQPSDAELRERVPNLAFDAFRPATEIADPRRVTGRATGGQRRRPTTVVAAQRRTGLVVDKRALAIGTGLDVAAVTTEHDRGGPTTVEDEDRLFAASDVQTGDGRRERARQQPTNASRQFLAQVDDLDGRRPADRPRREDDPIERPVPNTSDAVDGRRRRAEHDRGPGQSGQPDRRIAGLVGAASGRSCTRRRAPRPR